MNGGREGGRERMVISYWGSMVIIALQLEAYDKYIHIYGRVYFVYA